MYGGLTMKNMVVNGKRILVNYLKKNGMDFIQEM